MAEPTAEPRQEEVCLASPSPLLPREAMHSGWHTVLSQDWFIELRYWDARLQIWRVCPNCRDAETPEDLGCQGYVYLGVRE
ncbi:hypothetical protein ACLF3G_28235 [Falsiroseomonas sp. HC035]|uniref:hypothetical protein n=1 Tax=Falsiroseomonas sp. HC035 TaxID=3390999 RepID=UPI003D31EAB2